LLHAGPEVPVLANVWDCASASIVEQAGFPAIATSSAGVAYSLGYPDGQQIAMEEMLAVVKRVAAAVSVPVTADLEAGYGDIAATSAALVESGAVGLNLEDTEGEGPDALVPVARQRAKIAAVRAAGLDRGIHVVINARTDSFLAQIGDPASRFERSCERLREYIAAGADCVFVPGVSREDIIASFVEELRFPLNVLAVAGTPPIARLKQLGVARVSVGSGLARAALGHVRRVAEALRTQGTFDALLEGAIPYAEVNSMFRRSNTAL